MNANISVIIPCYNEESAILSTLDQTDQFLKAHFADYEIIVVDDGSGDNTKAMVEKLSQGNPEIKLLSHGKNMGKGASVKKGVMAARYDLILFSDADLSTPIEEIEKFIPHFQKGIAVCIGSRALRESELIKRQGFLRQNMGKTFNLILQALLFRGINDTQCGFKCFTREAALKIFSRQRLPGYCFDAEVLFIARRLGLSVQEIPVRWINRSHSRVHIFRDSIRMFFDILRIRFNAWRGLYEV